MIMGNSVPAVPPHDLPNGPGAAAILAAGIGCAVLGLFALLGDAFAGIGNFFKFYNPTGPLSGVTISAIVIWLAAWYVLDKKWGAREVSVGRVSLLAFALLAIGFALTFPPIMDLLQGKYAHTGLVVRPTAFQITAVASERVCTGPSGAQAAA